MGHYTLYTTPQIWSGSTFIEIFLTLWKYHHVAAVDQFWGKRNTNYLPFLSVEINWSTIWRRKYSQLIVTSMNWNWGQVSTQGPELRFTPFVVSKINDTHLFIILYLYIRFYMCMFYKKWWLMFLDFWKYIFLKAYNISML